MLIKTIDKKEKAGVVLIPPSKSDSQRAILAAGMAKGKSTLFNIGKSADELAMLATIEQLGAQVNFTQENVAEITGIDNFPNEATINIGESGLGIRLITSVLASQKGKFTILGKGSLCSRPMNFFPETLPQLGVMVSTQANFLPIEVEGPVHGDQTIEVDGSLSSQYLSGLLMALPLIDGETTIKVNDLKSIPYVSMTLDTLKQFGIEIENTDFKTFKIKGNQSYQPINYTIESDWSSASYWLVAAALGMKIETTGLKMSSLQADKALLDGLMSAKCRIIRSENGLKIDGTYRQAFEFDATHCPDLFPALVTLAAYCVGDSIFYGVSRLKNKESDRGIVLQKEFGKLGLQIDLEGDKMTVHGKGKLNGGLCDSNNDHRIAMCLGIAGYFSETPITINDAGAVKKSYPGFWEEMEC